MHRATAGISRVGGPRDITQGFQLVDRLAGRLLRHPLTTTDFGGGGTLRCDGLQGESVRRPEDRLALLSEPGVHVVDKAAESGEQQQR